MSKATLQAIADLKVVTGEDVYRQGFQQPGVPARPGYIYAATDTPMIVFLRSLAADLDEITGLIQADPANINELAALSADLKAEQARLLAEQEAAYWGALEVPFTVTANADPLLVYDQPVAVGAVGRPSIASRPHQTAPLIVVEVNGQWLRLKEPKNAPAAWVRTSDVTLVPGAEATPAERAAFIEAHPGQPVGEAVVAGETAEEVASAFAEKYGGTAKGSVVTFSKTIPQVKALLSQAGYGSGPDYARVIGGTTFGLTPQTGTKVGTTDLVIVVVP